MTRCIMVCVIEAKCTNINDKGQKNWIRSLKIENFNDFFWKNA